MTGLDWIILGIVILLALFGWAQGFVAGALALVGFAIGAWVGTRVGPLVLSEGADSGWAPAFALMGALVAGAVLAMGFEGRGARRRARGRPDRRGRPRGDLGARRRRARLGRRAPPLRPALLRAPASQH